MAKTIPRCLTFFAALYDHQPEVLENIKQESLAILDDSMVQRGLTKVCYLRSTFDLHEVILVNLVINCDVTCILCINYMQACTNFSDVKHTKACDRTISCYWLTTVESC